MQALYDTLYGTLPKIITPRFHRQTIYADNCVWCNACLLKDAPGDKIFMGTVGRYKGGNDILRYALVVHQQLLGIFGQAIAAIAERRVIIGAADPRVQADGLNNLPAIEPLEFGIGVQFVEITHAQGQIGV